MNSATQTRMHGIEGRYTEKSPRQNSVQIKAPESPFSALLNRNDRTGGDENICSEISSPSSSVGFGAISEDSAPLLRNGSRKSNKVETTRIAKLTAENESSNLPNELLLKRLEEVENRLRNESLNRSQSEQDLSRALELLSKLSLHIQEGGPMPALPQPAIRSLSFSQGAGDFSSTAAAAARTWVGHRSLPAPRAASETDASVDAVGACSDDAELARSSAQSWTVAPGSAPYPAAHNPPRPPPAAPQPPPPASPAVARRAAEQEERAARRREEKDASLSRCIAALAAQQTR